MTSPGAAEIPAAGGWVRRAARMVGRAGAGLVAAVGVARLLSATYQRRGDRIDRVRFAPPGRLVDIGGRRLHLWHVGAHHDGPTVIGIPALGGAAIEWTALARALSTDTSVCLYDRAGLE